MDLEGLGLLTQPVSRAPTLSRDVTRAESETPDAEARPPVFRANSAKTTATADADRRPTSRLAEPVLLDDEFDDDEEALRDLIAQPAKPAPSTSKKPTEEPTKRKANDDPLSDGVMAALSKLRKS
jgi:DNA excision repair protein ERCC-1